MWAWIKRLFGHKEAPTAAPPIPPEMPLLPVAEAPHSDSANNAPAQSVQQPIPVNFSGIHTPLQSIDYLALSGLITDDAARSDLLLLDRINDAGFLPPDQTGHTPATREKITTIQARFRQQMASRPYEELIAGGAVNELLVGYVDALADQSRARVIEMQTGTRPAGSDVESFNQRLKEEQQLAAKLAMEAAYYRGNPEVSKILALRYRAMLESGKYLPLARIAALSGLVHENAEVASDLVNDVLARMHAREMAQMKRVLPKKDILALYQKNSQPHALQIDAAAARMAAATAPIEMQPLNEPEFADLDRMQSMQSLLSAQLNAAATQVAPPAQKAEMLAKSRELIREYQRTCAMLSYHFLADGAAKDDPRILAMREHVAQDLIGMKLMSRQGDGYAPLIEKETAIRHAAALMRTSAEDILAMRGVDAQRVQTLEQLMKAAGIDNLESQSLQPRATLKIATELQPAAKAFGERLAEEKVVPIGARSK